MITFRGFKPWFNNAEIIQPSFTIKNTSELKHTENKNINYFFVFSFISTAISRAAFHFLTLASKATTTQLRFKFRVT